ncbi:dTDP-4-amino-4,6-dideoxygalactose transaminase [Azospirillum agricola]|uniref:DegT/DnrJ/EryC1/StrS family aminotransferase n=1 Tax=Azospirillum agricola TaxID=1720247 RepID=UPI001AE75471|nr:DegT/DnrJ/EryC1/StrS family aminotransferase [Azospirillum agricola]MBP2230098.1 dTDP-4-amino-4,6-dideoxygalactose transaminase [Azospirillum agricola]
MSSPPCAVSTDRSKRALLTVFRPRLPTADRLLPYLRSIDANQWYTNRGPLLARFERALADHFAVTPDRVVGVANATAGLSASLLAGGSEDAGRNGRPLCILPSWTHEATAVAVLRAGLTPWFHEVAEDDWRLSPEMVADSLRGNPTLGARVSHVMVTAPFGAVVEAEPWRAFSDRFGLPVTIDAASGFDRLRGGPVDAVVSLHATKVLGIGEGGVVIARDAVQAARIRDLVQLGLSDERVIRQAGMNAKLSEYGAAIGLAALEIWSERRATLERLHARYAARLKGETGLSLWAPEGVSSTLMVRLPSRVAVETGQRLAAQGIATRRWWHAGCHRQPAFAAFPRQPLPITEALADSVLGLPFHEGLADADVDAAADTLRGVLPG